MCVRKRERGSYTYEHYHKWGMINKSVAKDLSSILIIRLIMNVRRI